MILQCACCGGDAPAKKQWFNRDTGYGICHRCYLEDLTKVGPALAQSYYGLTGVHHSIPSDDLPGCDGSGPHLGTQVRILPEGGAGNSILCFGCYLQAMEFRRDRNQELNGASRFDLPLWQSLKVYESWEVA